MKPIKWIALAALTASLLSGCALLPREEALPQAPLVAQSADTEFTYTYVQKGDLVYNQRYTAAYKAVRVERLSFPVGGLHYDKIYVQKGDTVRADDLLMELEMGTLRTSDRQKRDEIQSLKLQKEQAEQNMELARQNYQIQLDYMDEEELEDALTMEETLRPRLRAVEQLEDRLTVAQAELEALQASIVERQLRAGIDGTVTYVRAVEPSDVTSVTESVVSISDSASSMFVIDTSQQENFPEGLEVQVVMEDMTYPCVVVSAASVGAEDDGKKVFLKTDLPTAELSDGDHGAVNLELDRRNDCLYVSAGAIKTMNGKSFVYVQQENGLRATVEVQTGFSAAGNVEILSGLEAGDAVILK